MTRALHWVTSFLNRNMALEGNGGVMKRLFFLAAALVFVSGCAHVISKDILQEVNREIRFAQLREAPQDYQGKVVLLGGVIVKTVNKKEGTLLEIYQTELDREGRPIDIDVSLGRFLALYEGHLDSEIYRRGRKVTIVGVVQGKEVVRLAEIDYRYPYLVVKEIHLWEEEQPRAYAPYPWGFRDPWWWYPGDHCWTTCRPWFCNYARVGCCHPWCGPRRYPVIYDCGPDDSPAIKSALFRRWLKERQARLKKQRVQLLPNHHTIVGKHQESRRSVSPKSRLISSSYTAIGQIGRESQQRLQSRTALPISRFKSVVREAFQTRAVRTQEGRPK
ncbi:MAG: Slp family lipoprotein, partial [Desulfobacterales bacterium]|nr:Slp family lipoprotein [Desulfobacterales bacterium]